jgi:hypothetical protein
VPDGYARGVEKGRATRVDIRLVIDRKNVTLGAAVEGEQEERG